MKRKPSQESKSKKAAQSKQPKLSVKELTQILNATSLRFPEAALTPKAEPKQETRGCSYVCDKWECTADENDTIHCTCISGHKVCN
jgi:hypothetical protein